MKVKFMPQNIECDINPGETVLSVAKRNGIFIKSICGGLPSCAECRVRLQEGEHHVNQPTRKELNLIGNTYYIDNRRLACQLRCYGDITVDLTEQVEKENQSSKRPQGGAKVPVEDSQAVKGNMILDEKQNAIDYFERKANEMVEREMRNQALRDIKNKKNTQQSSPSFYSGHMNMSSDYQNHDHSSSQNKEQDQREARQSRGGGDSRDRNDRDQRRDSRDHNRGDQRGDQHRDRLNNRHGGRGRR